MQRESLEFILEALAHYHWLALLGFIGIGSFLLYYIGTMDNQQQQSSGQVEQQEQSIEQRVEQSTHEDVNSAIASTSTQLEIQQSIQEQVQAQTTASNTNAINVQITEIVDTEENTQLAANIEQEFNENSDTIRKKYNPQSMREGYASLPRAAKVLLILAILAISFLIGWGSWYLISLVWPYILKFVKENWQQFVNLLASFLDNLARNPAFLQLQPYLETPTSQTTATVVGAVAGSPTPGAVAAAQPPDFPASTAVGSLFGESGSQPLFIFLSALFLYMGRNWKKGNQKK